MKRKIFYSLFLLFYLPALSFSFGFDVNQETIFSENTEYSPAFLDNNQTNCFFTFAHSFDNWLISIYPNLCFKDEKLNLNLYKFKFNLFFHNFAFSLDKDTFYYGNGTFENLSVPQSITIKDKDDNSWYSRFDFIFMGQTISVGTLLDKNIDYYKAPSYLNPFFIFNYSSTYFNLIYTFDYLWAENDSLKNSLEFDFLSTHDLSFYSTLCYVLDLSEKNDLKLNIGISKTFIFKNFLFSPLCELNYNFMNKDLGLLFNLHSDLYDSFNFETGISYSNSDTENLRLRTEINFYIKAFSVKFLYQSKNLLKNERMNKGYLSIGIKYEI